MNKLRRVLLATLVLGSAASAFAYNTVECRDGMPLGGPLQENCQCDGNRISCTWS